MLARADAQRQGDRPLGTHQDNTGGNEWIARLERPERLPGLKIHAVVDALGLKPGLVVADIGAGTGAFAVPFALAVAPTGTSYAVDIWPELLDHIGRKAAAAGAVTLKTVLANRDDPLLPRDSIDVAFFHDVFHNVNDRPGYLRRLTPALKFEGRIAIVEQEFDDPIAKQWDRPEDRITRDQVRAWMASVGFELVGEFVLFLGNNNPPGTGMPERWFVVYQRTAHRIATPR
jgi:ubiquinone/menaquinone biosynthesis C-methylase UbiE